MATWDERLRLLRNNPKALASLVWNRALSFVGLQDAYLRAKSRLITRRLMRRLRKADLCLFGVRAGGLITLVPTRRQDGQVIIPFALSSLDYIDWLASPMIGLRLVPRHERVLQRAGTNPISDDEWQALSFILHAEPERVLIGHAETFLTRDAGTGESAPILDDFDPAAAPTDVVRRRGFISIGVRDPELAPLLHAIEMADGVPTQFPPYGDAPELAHDSPSVPAEPKRRSVLFVNPAYYNFWHLADALRKRGWDAVAMGIVDPNAPIAKLYHGFDWNLFEPDPERQSARLQEAFKEVAGRFGMLHFYGVGTMSFFPYNWDTSTDMDRVPWDVLEVKRRGALIGYSITGCHDLVRPSAFSQWSGMCAKCAWRDQPKICSDQRMAGWGWKVRQLADLICIETDPPLDFRDHPAVFREPLTWATDPEHWRPELARGVPVPPEWQVEKAPGEILIYHSVGNYEARTRNGVNVKGTGPVLAAIERLRAEGHPVRLLFRADVPSIHNRWMLAQSDIIVDQLNYGRYGATTREALMLGRPVIARIDKREPRGLAPVRCIAETPVVDADEKTVYEVLKALVIDPEARARIGEAGRAHALQWWAKDTLAERYERVYDHLRAHGRPPATLDS